MDIRANLNKKNIKQIVILIILSLLLLLFVIWIYQFNTSRIFNSEVWRNSNFEHSGTKEYPRLNMADGLVSSKILLGKSSEEIESMLGAATETNYFHPEYNLVYWLGPERGFMSIDSEWLVIKLNENGHASEVRVVSD